MSEAKRKSKVQNSNSDAVKKPAKTGASTVKHPWTTDEVRLLLEQIVKFTYGEERERTYKSTKTRIDWTTINVSGHSEDECREALNSVLKQVRCERTMHEVLEDAHSLLDRGTLRLTERDKSCQCPAKKPSQFLIYRDTVLQKVQQEHPGVSGAELMRIIGKMYKELSDKRKKRVEEEFKEREAAYKAAIEQARIENPAFECPKHFPGASALRQRNTAGASSHRTTAPKARRPVDIYVAKKLDSKEVDDARRDDLTAKYTRKYEALPDSKKLKWIRRAQVELETTYREAAIAYWQTKPKFKPMTDYKRLLTTDERRVIGDLKEKHRPSLYTYFTTKKLRELTDVKGNERLSVAAQMWKELSPAEKKALEVEWQRECGGDAAGSSKPASKAASAAAKRKAAKDDEDSDSEVETPKRTRFEPPALSSSNKRSETATQKQPAVTTPKSASNAAASKTANAALNNNPAAKAKQRAVADVKPPVTVESSESETGSDDDESDNDRLPKQAPGKSNALTNAKKGAVSAKPAAKPATTASKAPVNRPSARQNGNSSSDDDDDDLSD